MVTIPQVEKLPRVPGDPHITRGQVFEVQAGATTTPVPRVEGNEVQGNTEHRVISITCRPGCGNVCVDPLQELDEHFKYLSAPPESATISGDRDSLGFDKFGRVVKHLGDKGVEYKPNA